MNKDNDILTHLNHHDGMTVPEGYFEKFAARMDKMLPERPELAADYVAPRSLWQRVRPYVYMAAMFAGVWCMLKMFTLIGSTETQQFESNPVLAEAFGNETFVNDYVISDVNQWDLYDELMDEGVDPESFCDSLAFNDLNLDNFDQQ
jgi:hypothetical protein